MVPRLLLTCLLAACAPRSRIDAQRARWNATYRDGTEFAHRPNAFLVDVVRGRHPGTALDVGMGQGRNTLYLASQGWDVTGVDISDEGIGAARREATARGLTIHTLNQDISAFDWGIDKWDLICFIYVGGREEVPDVRRSLKKGGMVVIEFFVDDAAESGAMFKSGEVPALYADGFKVIRYEQVEDVADWGGQRANLVRFAAERL